MRLKGGQPRSEHSGHAEHLRSAREVDHELVGAQDVRQLRPDLKPMASDSVTIGIAAWNAGSDVIEHRADVELVGLSRVARIALRPGPERPSASSPPNLRRRHPLERRPRSSSSSRRGGQGRSRASGRHAADALTRGSDHRHIGAGLGPTDHVRRVPRRIRVQPGICPEAVKRPWLWVEARAALLVHGLQHLRNHL